MTTICVRGLAALRPLFWLAAILTVATVASRAPLPKSPLPCGLTKPES